MEQHCMLGPERIMWKICTQKKYPFCSLLPPRPLYIALPSLSQPLLFTLSLSSSPSLSISVHLCLLAVCLLSIRHQLFTWGKLIFQRMLDWTRPLCHLSESLTLSFPSLSLSLTLAYSFPLTLSLAVSLCHSPVLSLCLPVTVALIYYLLFHPSFPTHLTHSFYQCVCVCVCVCLCVCVCICQYTVLSDIFVMP